MFLSIFIIGVNFLPAKVYCNQKIALFGDSLMSGYGLEKKFHLSTILEKNLKESNLGMMNYVDDIDISGAAGLLQGSNEDYEVTVKTKLSDKAFLNLK